MASKISDFLADVGSDASRREAFKKSPDAELDQSNLTSEQRDIVKSGDVGRIRKAIQEESGSEAIAVMFETLPEPIKPPKPPR